MDFLAMIGGIVDGFMQFLSGFLDTGFFWPTLLALIVAAVANPKGPTNWESLLISLIAGTIGAFLFVKLIRGSDTDALLLAFIVLAVGLVWLFAVTNGLLKKIITAVLFLASLTVLFSLSATAPPGTRISGVVVALKDAGTAVINAFSNAF